MRIQLLLALVLFALGNNAIANQRYEALGDNIQYAMPIIAMGMTYNEKDSEGGLQLLKTLGATFGATYSIKLGVNRTRPNGSDYSFPSGHTSCAFSSAGYIHQRYGYEKGRIAYLAASFVGWSRIQANKHYTTDVLAGAALGSLVSYTFTNNRDTVGINIHFRW